MPEKQWFSRQVLREELGDVVCRYLMEKVSEYGSATKPTNVEVIDLEGVDPLEIFEPKPTKRFICVMSYIFSNGYCLGDDGTLRKQYESLKEIAEETPLEELIAKGPTSKWLKKLGYTTVADILGLDFVELLRAGNSSRIVNGKNDGKRWYDIVSKLAGHGYVFNYDYNGEHGRISKCQSNLFPKIGAKSEIATNEGGCAQPIDWGRFGLPGPLTPEQLADPTVAALIAKINDLLIRMGELIQQLTEQKATLTNNQQIIEQQQAAIEAIIQLLETVRGVSPAKNTGTSLRHKG